MSVEPMPDRQSEGEREAIEAAFDGFHDFEPDGPYTQREHFEAGWKAHAAYLAAVSPVGEDELARLIVDTARENCSDEATWEAHGERLIAEADDLIRLFLYHYKHALAAVSPVGVEGEGERAQAAWKAERNVHSTEPQTAFLRWKAGWDAALAASPSSPTGQDAGLREAAQHLEVIAHDLTRTDLEPNLHLIERRVELAYERVIAALTAARGGEAGIRCEVCGGKITAAHGSDSDDA